MDIDARWAIGMIINGGFYGRLCPMVIDARWAMLENHLFVLWSLMPDGQIRGRRNNAFFILRRRSKTIENNDWYPDGFSVGD